MWVSTVLAALALASPQGDAASQVKTLIDQLGPRGFRGWCAVGNPRWGKGSPGEAAAIKLAAIGEPAVEPLIALISNPSYGPGKPSGVDVKRDLAIWTLAEIGDRRAVKAVVRVLEALPPPSSDRHSLAIQDGASAANAAARLHAIEAIPMLIGMLGDERPIPTSPHLVLGSMVKDDLVRFGPEASDPLLDVLKSSKGMARIMAAQALAALKEKRAYPAFESMLGSDNPRERIAGIDGLSSVGGPSADGLLLARLADQDDSVAEQAAAVIGSRGRETLGLFKRYLASRQPEVRRFALFGACSATYGSHECHLMLRAALRDPAAEVRWQALQILGYQLAIGKDEQALVLARTQDKDKRVRECAKEVLELSKGATRVQPMTYWRSLQS